MPKKHEQDNNQDENLQCYVKKRGNTNSSIVQCCKKVRKSFQHLSVSKMAFRFSLPKQQGPFEFLSLTVYGIFNQPLSRTVRSCVEFIKADQLAEVCALFCHHIRFVSFSVCPRTLGNFCSTQLHPSSS